MRGPDGSSRVLALLFAAFILAICAPQMAVAHCETSSRAGVRMERSGL